MIEQEINTQVAALKEAKQLKIGVCKVNGIEVSKLASKVAEDAYSQDIRKVDRNTSEATHKLNLSAFTTVLALLPEMARAERLVVELEIVPV